MNQAKEVSTQEASALQKSKEMDHAIRPAVDIFEDDSGITLEADMPGVSRDRLDVQIDSDSLSIMGDVNIPMPEGMEALYADVNSTRYKRSFSLSSELDRDNIDGKLKDGVLTLRIQKREEHKPRKIEIQTG